jgi:hypothetical protein
VPARVALIAVGVCAAALLGALVVIPGHLRSTTEGASSTEATTDQQLLKGLTFTPASFDAKGMSDYFAVATHAGDLVTWSGDWDALSYPQGAPYVIEAQAKQDNLAFLPELQVLNSSSGQLLRPLNSSNEAKYLSLAVSFAGTYRPQFMALGVEVNLLYESSPADFQSFASFFNATRAAIKEASPGTQVFTIFQLERMNGLDGGLFGGTNDASMSEWGLLADFPSADLVGFTTYPGLVYKNVSGIPSDYYSEIAQHTQKAVAFTEVGWQSGSLPGWENDQASQADFVRSFFRLTAPLPRALVVWAFAYDQSSPAPFDSMGLLDAGGTEKAAYAAWLGAP